MTPPKTGNMMLDSTPEQAAEQDSCGYVLNGDFCQLKNASIMMVDDEVITMEVVQALLEDAGYQKFILVDDALQAMSQVQEQRPDVLLLDVNMPGLSGFDILQMLREDPDFSHLPVIILTSSSDADTKLKALDLGATDFLSKPVDPSELALRVRNTLAAKAYQDQLAYYDVLTNLPNRHLFDSRAEWMVEQASREGTRLALAHISFPDFTRITDAFGPNVGDAVLKRLAQRLARTIRTSDAIGRTDVTGGGDDIYRVGSADFSVLLSNIEELDKAALVAQRVIDIMRAPLQAEGTDIYLPPSIGIAGFPDDASDAPTLMQLALGASAQSAAQGGGKVRFFSADINDASRRRLRMEADLRSALATNQFRLLYQPKVDVKKGTIVGAEALIRWQRSDGEFVSPADFIPVAEDTGLILWIGEWVLYDAAQQVAHWARQGVDIKVSVNLSAQQLLKTDIVETVTLACRDAGIQPSSLTLELTESMMMENLESTVQTMQRLREVGCKLSMDDFGTGYSSLSYLKRFPLDEVKIDRAFVVDALNSRQDQALITAVTYLAHEFGFTVCVEGVEQAEQLELLRKAECDQYQGFYFSPPIAPDLLLQKITESSD